MNLLFRTSHGCLACRERKKKDQACDGRRPIYRCHQQQHLTCPSPKKIPLKQVSRVDRPSCYSIFNASNLQQKKKKKNSTFNFCPNTNSRSLNGALFLKKCSKMFQNVNRQLPQLSLIKIRQESSPRKNRFSCRVKYFKVAHNCREKGGK